jgi:PHD/YefM family antitoxin component YafN of YafNO toxin-antitoxin module
MKTPQIEPVTSMVKDHKAVLAKLKSGPVFLAQRSRPAAVLVSVEQWDDLMQELELLWAEREAAISKWKLASGQSKRIRMSHEEVEQWLAEDRVDEPSAVLA